MNSVVLICNLVRDPELSYTPNTQTACCRFTGAVDRPKKDGQDQGADFIRIVVWGRSGEACSRYLSKGSQVAVRGRIQTGSYTDRDGKTVYTTDVVADTYNGVEFLGGSQGGNSSSHGRNDAASSSSSSFADTPSRGGNFDDWSPYDGDAEFPI